MWGSSPASNSRVDSGKSMATKRRSGMAKQTSNAQRPTPNLKLSRDEQTVAVPRQHVVRCFRLSRDRRASSANRVFAGEAAHQLATYCPLHHRLEAEIGLPVSSRIR